jgi:hypothetical protein
VSGGRGAGPLGTEQGRTPTPFYRQHLDFTCGPACLLMAMARYHPGLKPSRELEVDIWREANLVEAYATSRQGLALAAYRRGFRVRTAGNAKTVELLGQLGLELPSGAQKVARMLHRDLQGRCRRARIPETGSRVSCRDLTRWLQRGWTPLVLVNATLVGDVDQPHWVVVLRCTSREVVVHDPLARVGGSRLPRRRFQEGLGYRGLRCAVVVEGLRGGPSSREGAPVPDRTTPGRW